MTNSSNDWYILVEDTDAVLYYPLPLDAFQGKEQAEEALRRWNTPRLPRDVGDARVVGPFPSKQKASKAAVSINSYQGMKRAAALLAHEAGYPAAEARRYRKDARSVEDPELSRWLLDKAIESEAKAEKARKDSTELHAKAERGLKKELKALPN